MNHVLCDDCFANTKGEEKCCSHGTAPGVKCVECGKVRDVAEPYWHCLGTLTAGWECSCGARNPDGALVCASCTPSDQPEGDDNAD